MNDPSCESMVLSGVFLDASFYQRQENYESFINLQFDYCPSIWTNHDRKLNSEGIKIHAYPLSIACNDKKSTFPELLKKDKLITGQLRNLEVLVTEISEAKVYNNIQYNNIK